MTDPTPYMRALRASHDRLAGIAVSLDSDDLRTQSYATEWSVADVLSHLGSGAEIFALYVNAGGLGGEPPAPEDYKRIWETWNARSPEEQAARSVAANEALVSRFESLNPEQRASLRVTMFGGMAMDLAGVLGCACPSTRCTLGHRSHARPGREGGTGRRGAAASTRLPQMTSGWARRPRAPRDRRHHHQPGAAPSRSTPAASP